MAKQLEVTFQKSKTNGPIAWINGVPSFPDRKYNKSCEIGETWKVEISGGRQGGGMKGAVNFLKPIKKIEPQVHVEQKKDGRYDRSADKRGDGGGYGGPRQKRFGDGHRGRDRQRLEQQEERAA